MRAASVVRLELRGGWSCGPTRLGPRHPPSTHTHPVSLHSARCISIALGSKRVEGRAGIRAGRAVGAPHRACAHTVCAGVSDNGVSAEPPRPSKLLAELAGVRVAVLIVDGTNMNCVAVCHAHLTLLASHPAAYRTIWTRA
jgi:hypothetical protein